MNVFISGGCKNGKSYNAQKLAKEMAVEKGAKLYYLATMDPVDREDYRRILRHRQEREGWGFTTLEQPRRITRCLPLLSSDSVVLLDSVTALLSNEMFQPGGEGRAWSVDLKAWERVMRDLEELADNTGGTVFVSDYIYGDPIKYDKLTEEYRKGLAAIDKALAQVCDKVIEISAGCRLEYK